MDKNSASSKEVPFSKEHDSISIPKQEIAKAIKKQMEAKGLTIRKVADSIENFNHPQLVRITQGENYNINTLLKVLDSLDMDLKAIPKLSIKEE